MEAEGEMTQVEEDWRESGNGEEMEEEFATDNCNEADKDGECQSDNGTSESVLRSRRPNKQTTSNGGDEEEEEFSQVSSTTTTITARFHVPETSSSESPSSEEDIQQEEEEDDDDANSLNDTTIRLNQVCEAACANILVDWESTLTNNNVVESKRVAHSPKPPSSAKAGEENETDPTSKVTSWLLQAAHFRCPSPLLKQPLSFYVQLAKDLLEVLVFTVLLVGLAYGVWLVSRFWYVRTTRNSQDAIYPVLRTMRITSLAFLFNYPNAQELYEEACILQNPFYEMNDVSCWPCENVRHMLDFTGFSNFTSGYYQSGIPFIVKDALAKGVHFDDLYNLLKEDPTSNLTSTAHLLSSHPEIQSFDQFYEWTQRKDSNRALGRKIHVTWKVNRAQYARMMRTLFQRPYYIPQETEISVQHFLFLDEPDGESYPLPITEFANVFLMQGDGPRLVVLVPVRHCQNVCKPIRVLLESRDVLYYNWLFWRPIISPVKTAGITNHSLSITYMGSFY